MSLPVWVLVAIMGALGALARYAVDQGVTGRVGSAFPVGTLAVNGSGSALLGVAIGWGVGGSALVVLGAGAIGSYTTFSTWMFESHRLAEDGQGRLAVANIASSMAVGLVCAGGGWWVGSLA